MAFFKNVEYVWQHKLNIILEIWHCSDTTCSLVLSLVWTLLNSDRAVFRPLVEGCDNDHTCTAVPLGSFEGFDAFQWDQAANKVSLFTSKSKQLDRPLVFFVENNKGLCPHAILPPKNCQFWLLPVKNTGMDRCASLTCYCSFSKITLEDIILTSYLCYLCLIWLERHCHWNKAEF